jgi:polysaccharide deacetylase 2 family uncharacterized protein YibQ
VNARTVGIVALLLVVPAGCTGSTSVGMRSAHYVTRATTSTSSAPPAAATTTSTTLAPDVAALPDGHGASIAIVVDDTGLTDTYLRDYLSLPIPITFSIIPSGTNAPADDAAVAATGKEVLLHLPLANRPGPTEPSRLAATAPVVVVEHFVVTALARVPHAVGANNHEGSFGSTSRPLMLELLTSLKAHGLFFMDSVTSQRTVGFALEAMFGMPPRINNVFLDHYENDDDSREALLALARDAAANGGAIGICHVFHPYELHALQALAAQLQAKGYAFAPLSRVTDKPTPGLDRGVRAA